MLTSTPKIKLPLDDYDDDDEEEIILHLPISKSDILSINNNNYSLEDIVEKIIN